MADSITFTVNTDQLGKDGPKLAELLSVELGRLLRHEARPVQGPADAWAAERALLDLFDIDCRPEIDPPVAALTGLADGLATSHWYWMRLEPVSLVADRSRLVMIATANQLQVATAEAALLADLVRSSLAAKGCRFFDPLPSRWYLQSEAPFDLTTVPPEVVLDESIDDHLPKGSSAIMWHAIFNEVQMALHDSAVNQAREAVGQLPVNALWFCGTGALPDAAAKDITLSAADPLLRGLGTLTSATLVAPIDGIDQLHELAVPGQKVIVDITAENLTEPIQRGDPGGLRRYLKALLVVAKRMQRPEVGFLLYGQGRVDRYRQSGSSGWRRWRLWGSKSR